MPSTVVRVPLYFVRHAKAGNRSEWRGDDEQRPLSKNGRRQAHGIAKHLRSVEVPRLLSSPYVRCVQTLEPLAEDRGLKIESIDALAEGSPFEPVLELLVEVPDHTVLCSHGDVIPETIDALLRRGMELRGEPDWRKGVTWVLERVDGEVRWARALPPPS